MTPILGMAGTLQCGGEPVLVQPERAVASTEMRDARRAIGSTREKVAPHSLRRRWAVTEIGIKGLHAYVTPTLTPTQDHLNPARGNS